MKKSLMVETYEKEGSSAGVVLKRIVSWFLRLFRITHLIRPYTVEYLVSYGAMCIHTKEYQCFACCKYHAFIMFLSGTIGEDHYSDRSRRTPAAFIHWIDDIKS